MKRRKDWMARRSVPTWASFLLVLLLPHLVAAFKCPSCATFNPDAAEYCRKCLRGFAWQMRPKPRHPFTIIARSGKDTFIRGPNDIHPRNTWEANSGNDQTGPIGSFYSPTGLRYLLWFDLPAAFARAGIPMKDFSPQECLLLLRYPRQPQAWEDVPIIVFPLTRPFIEGTGRWGEHRPPPDGATWNLSTRDLSWSYPGGDFLLYPRATSAIPASGTGEITIDVTEIYQMRWQQYQKSGKWEEPGLIIMRDPERPGRGLFRMIYSFQAAPPTGVPDTGAAVLSPELLIR